jgi:hypothetical protein
MTAVWIWYATLVTVLVAFAATFIERIAEWRRWPRRWTWLAALGISIGCVMLFGMSEPDVVLAGPTTEPSVAAADQSARPQVAQGAATAESPVAIFLQRFESATRKFNDTLNTLSGPAGLAWPLASVALIAVFGIGVWRLRPRSMAWN